MVENSSIALVNERLKGEASWHLNAMRGIAAVMVLLNHFRNIFFVTYQDIENQNIFTLFLYSFSGLGHEAVMVFFVLSGFLISNSVIKSIGNWSWLHYLINRVTRLSIVLVPALLIGLTIDLIGLNLFDYSFFPHDMSTRINTEVFIGNLLYLQGFAVTVLGTNDPLWSLSYEFWYYLLFPMIVLAVAKGNSLFVRLSYLIAAVICLFIVGKTVMLYFFIWLMGVVILTLPAINIKNRLGVILIKSFSLMFLLASLGISRLGLISNSFVGDTLVAVAFSLLVYVTIHLQSSFKFSFAIKESYRKIAEWLSSFSYTLYLIHFPILIFMFALLTSYGMEKMQPTSLNVLIGVGVCGVVTILAYLLSLVTEGKTSQLKKVIYAGIAFSSKEKILSK